MCVCSVCVSVCGVCGVYVHVGMCVRVVCMCVWCVFVVYVCVCVTWRLYVCTTEVCFRMYSVALPRQPTLNTVGSDDNYKTYF